MHEWSDALRISVVSPFLDRRHGTELCVIEQIERLSSVHGWQIDLFSHHVEDVEGLLTEPPTSSSGGFIRWHKIPALPGPHLIKFVWWLLANHYARALNRRKIGGARCILYSPGINCLDADAITVHIVFHEFSKRASSESVFRRLPITKWPVALHRKIYYKLIMLLERRVYTNPRVRLAAVSAHVAAQLEKHFHRTDVAVIPNAVDTTSFNPDIRLARRLASRKELALPDDAFVLLFIGNDWKTKGLDVLLRALAIMPTPAKMLVVGGDDVGLYQTSLQKLGLEGRVRFLTTSSDVLSFYAACDCYVAPTLEDAFGLPIIEAMACGLPVVASIQAGASEQIKHGENGYLLENPHDHVQLADLIEKVASDPQGSRQIGAAAAKHVQSATSWNQNVRMTKDFLEASAALTASR